MPDVDWEKVAADVADLPDDPSLFVEWFAFADHPTELILAARWGLEAQQRGVEAHLSSEPLDIGGLMWRVTVPHVLGTYMEGPHLLVPLEGEQ